MSEQTATVTSATAAPVTSASETVTPASAPVTSSSESSGPSGASDYTPGSTESIAAATLQQLDSDDADGGDGNVTPVTTKAPAAAADGTAAAVVPAVTPDPDDFATLAAEVTDAMGRKRENKIPHSRVKTMLEKERAKVQAEADAKFTEQTARFTEYEQTVQAMTAVEQLMQTNPEGFLAAMAEINPAYARYVQNAAGQGGQAAAQHAPATERPQPDVRYTDGTTGYSQEGLQRLLDWNAAQVEARITQKFAPVEQFVGSVAEQQRQHQVMAQAQQAVNTQLADAYTWPGFKDAEGDILAALKADPKATLESAYRKVVVQGRLSTDRNKIREEVLKEINGQPRNTAAPVSQTTPKPQTGPRTTEDIARETLARLNSQS